MLLSRTSYTYFSPYIQLEIY
uniref:Uncharacterized protein n=1 Tax=Anguilla anguilla TaxID=7936 RepID=A0A0E9SF15_ANGAN